MELSENVQLIDTKYGKISQSPDEFAWDQRYRPTTIDECILLLRIKKRCAGLSSPVALIT